METTSNIKLKTGYNCDTFFDKAEVTAHLNRLADGLAVELGRVYLEMGPEDEELWTVEVRATKKDAKEFSARL